MSTNEKNVLIVDDEPSILNLLENFLSMDREHYQTFLAYNAQEAIEILAEQNIFLVISDIYMPEISGFDLLASIRNLHPEIKVILMTGYNSPELREEVKQSGCLYFLEKPVDLQLLRKIISKELARTQEKEGFVGTLKNIQLTDLIQMCCMSAISTTIRVHKSGKEGIIYIEDGEIVHAACNGIEGVDAFYEILKWKTGAFETLGAGHIPMVSIHHNWQFLLMEGQRRVDEHMDIQDNSGGLIIGRRKEKIKILIVDDSAMMTRILYDIFEADEEISVIGTARNGEEALKMIDQLKPDLITLDVNMPIMDGSTALKHIMIKNPCPVVIISAMGSRSAVNVLDFLHLGALDFISKPSKNQDMEQHRKHIVHRIKLAATANINLFSRIKMPKVVPDKEFLTPITTRCDNLVILISGPGGYVEISKIIPYLPQKLDACILVLQTMPDEFVPHLSDYLDKRSRISVFPLISNVPISPDRCYIGITESPMFLIADDSFFYIERRQEDQGRNPVDCFLESVANIFTGRVDVFLMSGADIGSLAGLQRLKEKKGRITAQKKDTCMVSAPVEFALQARLVENEMGIPEILKRISAFKSCQGRLVPEVK